MSDAPVLRYCRSKYNGQHGFVVRMDGQPIVPAKKTYSWYPNAIYRVYVDGLRGAAIYAQREGFNLFFDQEPLEWR